MKLDIGCGKSKKEGYIGVDQLNLNGVDIIYNLNKYPYPFKDDSVSEIWMDQVLEHLDSPIDCVNELYRICKHGAKITIGVPYFRSIYASIDPTHKNFFTSNWFNYFDPNHEFSKKYCYSESKFLVKKIEFDREFKGGKMRFHHKFFVFLAEKKTCFYELRLSHLYPLSSLTFYLEVIK